MSEPASETVGRPVEGEEPRNAMAYRVAELKKAVAERESVLAELRTRFQVELDSAALRTALAQAQGAVQVARLQMRIEKVQGTLEAERATRERLEGELRAERDRYAVLAHAIASVPWWAPWRRQRLTESLALLREASPAEA